MSPKIPISSVNQTALASYKFSNT